MKANWALRAGVLAGVSFHVWALAIFFDANFSKCLALFVLALFWALLAVIALVVFGD